MSANANTLVNLERGGATLTIKSGGTLSMEAGSTFTRPSRKRLYRAGAKVGATAGWVVAGATNIGDITLPASQTGSTLVIPITGLEVGDIITGFSLVGQVESAGGTVTVAADLRALTAVAADNTDASIGAVAAADFTTDTLLGDAAGVVKSGLTETVAIEKAYYMLITATTAGSTDIALMGVQVVVTKG